MLVAAFRATLEEVIEADVILHVRDMSHEDADAQSQDVAKVLGELGIEASDRRLIEVWNKIDRLDAEARARLANLAERQPAERRPVLVSAVSGEGIDALTRAIETRLGESRQTLSLSLDPADGAGLSWLYRHAEVLSKEMDEDGRLAVTVRADPDKAARVRAKFGALRVRARGLHPACLFAASALAASHSASISASVASFGVLPRAASARSIDAKRRSNLALVARSTPSGSAPRWRARLTTANSRSPTSAALCAARAGVELGFDLVGFLADLGEHRARIVPVEADPAGLVLQLEGAGQRGQGDRHAGERALLRRLAALGLSPPP